MSIIKKALLLFVFSSLFLISCSEPHRMIFIGESDHWRVQYNVNVEGTDSQTGNYTINYLGDIPLPEKIDYSFEVAGVGKDSGHISFNKSVKQIEGGACSGCAIIGPKDKIKAIIKWNEKEERFLLESE